MRSDAEITEFVLENCESNFSTEFLEKLSSNSQSFRLSTKYELIEKAIENDFKTKNPEYTQEMIDISTSKAYIYAKMVSGKFTEIRPKVDSSQILDYIIKNYEDGYKYMLEAIFMKIGINGISNYVKGKIDGNAFYAKISKVTNSKPSEIKRNAKSNAMQINKIKNLVFEIGVKQEQSKWLDSRIERKTIKKSQSIDNIQYNLNYAQ